jgi:uncharacterized membrane protein
MSREGAADAVERGGPSLLAALGPAGDRLSPEDMHTLRHADKEGRRGVMRAIMKARGIEHDDE